MQPFASRANSPAAETEKSITTTYRKRIWNPFIQALKEYDMIQPEDRIAVCISGGKDSMLLAKCMQHLQKYSSTPFSLVYLVMDPGYTEQNLRRIQENAELLELPICIREKKIFEVTARTEKSPCYLCARMRRGCLYKLAQELGCNKIALGHHFDDVVETILMSLLYGAEAKTMMPKLHSSHYPGMELIRPLYLVKEADILAWRDRHHLEFLQCACRLTEGLAQGRMESKRQEMKQLLAQLQRMHPAAGRNLFLSMQNVNLGTLIGYKSGDVSFPFLEEYSRPGSPYYSREQAAAETEAASETEAKAAIPEEPKTNRLFPQKEDRT